MPPKPKHSDLIAIQVMREQEWCYDKRRAHLSIREIARATIEAPPVGLGYYLSPHQIKGLLGGYLERMRETLEESPAEAIAQELADLDMQYRAAAQLAGEYTGEVTVDPDTGVEVKVRRDERVILAALATLRQINERRAKLLGLDAPTASTVAVTVTDATDAAVQELAAEVERRAKAQR